MRQHDEDGGDVRPRPLDAVEHVPKEAPHAGLAESHNLRVLFIRHVVSVGRSKASTRRRIGGKVVTDRELAFKAYRRDCRLVEEDAIKVVSRQEGGQFALDVSSVVTIIHRRDVGWKAEAGDLGALWVERE